MGTNGVVRTGNGVLSMYSSQLLWLDSQYLLYILIRIEFYYSVTPSHWASVCVCVYIFYYSAGVRFWGLSIYHCTSPHVTHRRLNKIINIEGITKSLIVPIWFKGLILVKVLLYVYMRHLYLQPGWFPLQMMHHWGTLEFPITGISFRWDIYVLSALFTNSDDKLYYYPDC